MKSREERRQAAAETVAILQDGHYEHPVAGRVEIAAELQAAIDGTRLIRPGDWGGIVRRGQQMPRYDEPPYIEVTGETTLAAARRLVKSGGEHVTVLNFASARNPGGGFLNGSLAQEESIAVASGLYPCLLAAREYYDENGRCRSLLYTDHAIWSPRVPVIRDDAGRLVERPCLVSVITMPAPNVGAIGPGHPDLDRVTDVLGHRVQAVLALAAAEGCTDLVLGAWGCGVFRNDPREVARMFRESLLGSANWVSRFCRTVFAVFDTSYDKHVLKAFEQELRR